MVGTLGKPREPNPRELNEIKVNQGQDMITFGRFSREINLGVGRDGVCRNDGFSSKTSFSYSETKMCAQAVLSMINLCKTFAYGLLHIGNVIIVIRGGRSENSES